MNDAWRRAVRTFIQAFLGSILTSGILSAVTETGVVDWATAKKVAVSALAASLIAAITFAQNALESADVIPKLLKK